jgi:glycosyltransferase involved in cell wall biosynthesis
VSAGQAGTGVTRPASAPSLRIGVDVSCCWNRRGFGRFARELLGSMVRHEPSHEWLLVTDRPPGAGELPDNCRVIDAQPARTVTESAVAGSRRSIRDLRRFRRTVERLDVDVFFFPAVYSYFPLPRRIPQVVCFHDTIAEDHPALIFDSAWERLAWWVKVRSARRAARRFMTVSHASKRRLMDRFHLAPDRIDVVSEGASDTFHPRAVARIEKPMPTRLDLAEGLPYFLSVGGLSPHKNLGALLDAFEALPSTPACALVLVGDPDADGFLGCGRSLSQRVRDSARLTDSVRFTGYVSDEDLADLYRGATALVFPSLAEGFGLPALEALSCGTPVLASRAGSLPEVVGDAGLYFDPTDIQDMTACMTRYLSNEGLQAELRGRTARQAAQYSWGKAADEALACLRKAAS